MILDTNALSDWAKAEPRLLAVLDPQIRLLLPVIVLGEYLAGVVRSTQRAPLEAWLNRAMSEVKVAPVTVATAEAYASIKASLVKEGRPIPANDLWIAALAIQHRLPVLSRDTHFDAVDGLRRIGW